MKYPLDRTPGVALAVTALAGIGLTPGAASAQFSAREGYASDGADRVGVELTSYRLLPAPDASIGLQHPPGLGVQGLPVDADLPFMHDVRTGFSCVSTDAATRFENSRFGGISHTGPLVEPWPLLRGTWIISPDRRFTAEAAGTGFRANGGAWGWNGRVGVACLVTSWLDVSLGYDGFQTTLPSGSAAAGQAQALRLLSYGPIVGIGLRF
jgi:hypothetical protein